MQDIFTESRKAPQQPQERAAAPPSQAGADKVEAVSVALYASEFDALQAYANEHHASRGSLLTALVRRAWAEVQAGRFQPETRGLKFISKRATPPH